MYCCTPKALYNHVGGGGGVGGGLSSRKMHIAVLSLAVISSGNYIILYIIADIGEPLLCRALKLLLNAF